MSARKTRLPNMKPSTRATLVLMAISLSLRAQLPPTIAPEAYAADLKAILDRSSQLSHSGSPVPILAPRDNWALGMVSWITADSTGLVYLLHRGDKAAPIVVLDQKGKVIRSWGAGLFQTAHSIRLDPQGTPAGDVLISPGLAGKPHIFKASRAPVEEPRIK